MPALEYWTVTVYDLRNTYRKVQLRVLADSPADAFYRALDELRARGMQTYRVRSLDAARRRFAVRYERTGQARISRGPGR